MIKIYLPLKNSWKMYVYPFQLIKNDKAADIKFCVCRSYFQVALGINVDSYEQSKFSRVHLLFISFILHVHFHYYTVYIISMLVGFILTHCSWVDFSTLIYWKSPFAS